MDSGERGKFGRQVLGEDLKPKAKAAPELLRADLRRLPGEVVTKDIDDADRVHELDAPHIRDVLAEEAREKSGEAVWAGESEAPPPPDAPPPEVPQDVGDNRQLAVDIVRLRILRAWASSEADYIGSGGHADLRFRYVWFPEAGNWDSYEWRSGAVPLDRDRPAHLRGLDLILDLTNTRLTDKIIEHIEARTRPADKRFLAASQKILRPDAWMTIAALRGQL